MKTLQEIVRPSMTRRQARSALKKAGWEFIGGGSFAAVYASPAGDRVVRVNKPDRGADITYRLAQEHPANPHFPVYYDRIPLANGGAVFEVERLVPFTGWDDYETAHDKARKRSTFLRFAEDLLNAEDDGDAIGEDMHWRNAMKRADGTFVWTDYLADMEALHDASVSAGQAYSGDFDDEERQGSNHWTDLMEAA